MDVGSIQEFCECSIVRQGVVIDPSFPQAVLKRVLRVPHPMLQLHVLKLIKSQVPFCGRKWRQCEGEYYDYLSSADNLTANMKVITSIYLNCRPDLRDEWLTGNEVDDVSDAQVSLLIPYLVVITHTRTQAQEQALRHLVKFCKLSFIHGQCLPGNIDHSHR